MTTSVVAVSAGLSSPSSSRLLADRLAIATARLLPDAEVTVLELRELAADIAHASVTGFPAGPLADAVAAVRDADAVILVSPVFNASYSGLFKSFVDVLEPDTLKGKPVALGATGGTARHSLALEFAYRPLLAYLRAQVAPTAVFAASEDFGAAGPQGTALSARIDAAADELADLVLARAGRTPADTLDEPIPFERLLAG